VTASGLANKGLRARLTAVGAVGLMVVVASAVLPWVEKGNENGANSLALVEQPVNLLLMMVAAVVAAMVLAVLWLVRSTRRWAPAAGLVGSVLGLTAVAALWIGIAAGDGAETKGDYGALLLWFGWCWVLACVGADAVSQALD